jgi:hypothetical protein
VLKEMYRCELCGIIVPPRTRAHRVVLEEREKAYPFRPEAFRAMRLVHGRLKEVWNDDPGGWGREVVREVRACPACAGVPPGVAD